MSRAEEKIGPRRVEVLGVAVDPLTRDGLCARVAELARRDRERPATVLNVNAHALNLVRREEGLRRALAEADVVFADGFGVVLAARLAGGRLPGRITYADWAWNLARLAEAEGLSVFLLGARPGVAERAAGRLLGACPKLRVAGTHHGYFDRRPESRENREVLERIREAAPDLLLVGLGMPAQEDWISRNRDRIEARVALSCGAAFDYVSGELRRGPVFLRENGFEWLARLLIEPGRLWRRYLLGNPVFLARALGAAVRARTRGKRSA